MPPTQLLNKLKESTGISIKDIIAGVIWISSLCFALGMFYQYVKHIEFVFETRANDVSKQVTTIAKSLDTLMVETKEQNKNIEEHLTDPGLHYAAQKNTTILLEMLSKQCEKLERKVERLEQLR